jgi:hypothetical protein
LQRFPQMKYYCLLQCPFPIRSYARLAYGDAFIEFFLRQVQVCSCWRRKGWLCPNCCFPYRGRTDELYNGHGRVYGKRLYERGRPDWKTIATLKPRTTPHIPADVLKPFRELYPALPYATRPCTFMWSLFFARHPVKALCEDPLCCNLHHLELTLQGIPQPDPWMYMDVCEHGSECALCCWPWEGPRRTNIYWADGTVTRLSTANKDRIAKAVWFFVNGLPKHLYHHLAPYVACGTPNCSNPAHILVRQRTPKEVRTLRKAMYTRLWEWDYKFCHPSG